MPAPGPWPSLEAARERHRAAGARRREAAAAHEAATKALQAQETKGA
jgi:hypothetical protein